MRRARNGLRQRHVAFLTIGGTIGGGLFLGVGQGIRTAGPAMMLAFLVAGAAVLVVARCLGDMALAAGGTATFVRTTRLNLGRRTAFVEGWSYWVCAILTCMAELAAAGVLVRAWLPVLPPWMAALGLLVVLHGLNGLSIRIFGEIEFWMALLKVLACLAVLALGMMIALDPDGSGGAGLRNLWADGGVLPNGWRGLLLALPVAVFAFGGSELIGLAMADADEPVRALGRVGTGVIIPITALYVGVTASLLVAVPWRSMPVADSPFVSVLSWTGLPHAGTIMAMVLLSAILSSCNSCLYGATRVLASLAEEGLAPASLGLRSHRGAPAWAAGLSSCVVAVAIALELLAPVGLFAILLAASAVTGLVNRGIFTTAHLRLVRRTRHLAITHRPRPWTNLGKGSVLTRGQDGDDLLIRRLMAEPCGGQN